MKVVLYANTDWYIFNFRLPLVFRLIEEGYSVIIITPKGKYFKKFEENNIEWAEIPLKRSKYNLWNEFKTIFWINAFLKKNKIDLIHVFTLRCSFQVLFSVFLNSKIFSIYSITGLGYLFTKSGIKYKLLQYLVLNLIKIFHTNRSRFILQNEEDFNLFSKIVKNKKNIFLVKGSGVNCEKFKKVSNLRSSDNIKVLFCSRLLRDKGIIEFIDAVRCLRECKLNISFFVCGVIDESNPSSISKKQLNFWIDDKLFTYLGHEDDMNDLYNSVDILVLPSYREGLSKVLLEASACELAIITTSVPGCQDLIKDNDNGVLIQPKSSSQIVEAINKLYYNQNFRKRIGIRARQVVLSQYTESNVNEKTLFIYKLRNFKK